jgi:DNA helicase HerA-like ATPase
VELTDAIKKLGSIDLFKEAKQEDWFAGRPFYLDYSTASILVSDAWKQKVGGIAQGAFLLAFYENESNIEEALLLRALRPTKLPTDSEVIGSMVEYYKDNLQTAGAKSQLDDFTRYMFSFSGLECRVLGTFYKDDNGKTVFGADLENFYSAHNYSVFKPKGKVLEYIVNFRDGKGTPGGKNDARVGAVRYSSSRRFTDSIGDVSMYVSPKDFLGRRTALFGMTRTGKSNTVKKIIQSTVEIGDKAKHVLATDTEWNSNPYEADGSPRYPIGQIIFDINGEYANPNLQDEGTAIYDLYKDRTVRYSELSKEGFEVMKVNFFREAQEGFYLVQDHFKASPDSSDYMKSFLAISLDKPEDYDTDRSVSTRYDRKVAAYLACLHKAGFTVPDGFKVRFQGAKEINDEISVDPSKGITLQETVNWFEWVWKKYEEFPYLKDYPKTHQGREWADEELRSLLVVLTRKSKPTGAASNSGYIKLRPLRELHTEKSDKPFTKAIIEQLREGKIVIIDLSQGNPDIQRLYSERICQEIFADSMKRFIANSPNNFVQMYFEEAHNLFPKKEDKDLSQIYNRLAKEGAKLSLGLIYATQEVSSISSNILKNTQNWFIAHLNNEEEIKELRKYYDFGDFTDSLVRFSSSTDQGFVRMKTYSNAFIVPVQIDKFSAAS